MTYVVVFPPDLDGNQKTDFVENATARVLADGTLVFLQEGKAHTIAAFAPGEWARLWTDYHGKEKKEIHPKEKTPYNQGHGDDSGKR